MRENKTRYAILGMLSRADVSGYDIRKALVEAAGVFWSESSGQIYPIIKGLADEGLATKTVQRQEGRPDRHVYSITDAGRDELRRWLERPTDMPTYRLEFLLKLFFGYEASIEGNIRNLERFHDIELQTLRELQAMEQHLKTPDREHDPGMARFWLLALECGLSVHSAYVAWAEDAISELRQMDAEDQERPASESRTF